MLLGVILAVVLVIAFIVPKDKETESQTASVEEKEDSKKDRDLLEGFWDEDDAENPFTAYIKMYTDIFDGIKDDLDKISDVTREENQQKVLEIATTMKETYNPHRNYGAGYRWYANFVK